MTALISFFSPLGALAKTIKGYQPRQAQIDMAEAISQAIETKHHFIAEAGTGTGKTFAYLVPAVLSGKKILVSTGTKNLQDQLFNTDLPLLRKALQHPFSAALLKGRSNYLCLLRLKNAQASPIGFAKEEAMALQKIGRWAGRTKTGDVSEMADVPEHDPIWYQATSTVDNCLGQECDDYAECFLMKARKKAQESDILVINHHLLCADWSIRDNGFGELLPHAEVIIIDEAHQLADTASNFLGMHLGGKQLTDLCQDTLIEFFSDATDLPDLRNACENLEHEVKTARLALGMELKRGAWQELASEPQIMASFVNLNEHLRLLTQQLLLASVKSKGLDNCFKRAEALQLLFQGILSEQDDKWIRWYEVHRKSFTLSRTPLDIAQEFKLFMQHHKATWIFTSATLSVAHSFEHFAQHLGLSDATSACWDSPFDYAKQSLFYHPKGLPQPSDPNFIPLIMPFALPVLQASQGRAFFLFTSHRALKQAESLLKEQLDYPLLVQGSQPKSLLLEKFKNTPHAVLLGTSSFWEGVDVRGEALSCVIIDKLPFASPHDPVLKARLDALTQQGRNAFFDYQVPAAVIALRQGIGRLIRDEHDTGVLMICDPRLLKRAYGQQFLDSVPPMRRTRDITEVNAFFAEARTTHLPLESPLS